MGTHPSRGLKKGVVVNIEATVNAIQRALEEAELMADCKIREVYTGIAGSHIRSFNSQGMVAIKDKEVDAGRHRPRDRDREGGRRSRTTSRSCTSSTQEFIIDGQEDVREPLGMSGVRLEVKVHIVTGAVSAAQNIIKCVRRCGLEVQRPDPAAARLRRSRCCPTTRRTWACAWSTSAAAPPTSRSSRDGAIRHTAVIPIAGDQITNDIAMALRTPTKDAEELKVRYGCALRQLADPQRDDRGARASASAAPRELSRQTLAEVIEPRVEELYSLVQAELRRRGFEELLSSGVVLTGGSRVMQGMVELGEEIFHMPVRVGRAALHGRRSPRWCATRATRRRSGLLHGGRDAGAARREHRAHDTGSGSSDVLERMKEWFKGNF